MAMNQAAHEGSLGKQSEIARFVRQFFESFGAEVSERGSNVIEVRLSNRLAQSLGCHEALRLAFEPRGDGEFVTFGHPLLDTMLDMARERGLGTSLLFSSSMDPEFVQALQGFQPLKGEKEKAGQTDDADALSLDADPSSIPSTAFAMLKKRLGRFRIVNARSRVLGRRLVHQRQVMFHFKVSFAADEKREMTKALLIDPVTEEIDRPVDVSRAVSFEEHIDTKTDGFAYMLDRLYRQASKHLEDRLKDSARSFEDGVNERLFSELARIDEYYDGLLQERIEPLRGVFRRMASARVRADLARTWQTEHKHRRLFEELKTQADTLESVYERELEEINQERKQRTREVYDKYKARAEIFLTHAAFVMVPRVEWRVRLIGPARREMELLYDVLRQRLVGWQCEACDQEMTDDVYLCQCESVVCSRCHHVCDECEKTVCEACARDHCHICGTVLCESCDDMCPAGKSFVGFELPKVCQACQMQVCPTCVAFAGFGAEEVWLSSQEKSLVDLK